MRWTRKLNISLLVIALFLFSPTRANAATVSDISQQLICQCGCTMVLLNCSHTECTSREAMTTLISENLAKGQSETQIIQIFVAEYGEQVLAAPPKRGFNLTAWVMPLVALLLGAVAIYLGLKKWVRPETPSQTDAMVGEDDEIYQRQLEEELAAFKERSFR